MLHKVQTNPLLLFPLIDANRMPMMWRSKFFIVAFAIPIFIPQEMNGAVLFILLFQDMR
jgi:hypothetical protein